MTGAEVRVGYPPGLVSLTDSDVGVVDEHLVAPFGATLTLDESLDMIAV